MKPWPVLVLGLLGILPAACQKGRFTEVSQGSDTYEVKVIDPSADATAGGTTTATVEGPQGTDTADSGSGAGGSNTDGASSGDGKSSTDSGASGAGTSGDGKSSTDSSSSGSGSTTDSSHGKGKSKDSGKSADDDADAGDCAASAGLNKSRVKVSGSQKNITLTPTEAFALKVTGNQNVVHLKMSSDTPGARVAAICLFLAGNQAHVTMDIGVSVGRIYVKARGNKALVEADVSKVGAIEAMQVDARGNQPSIVLSGEGKYSCELGSSAVTCEKP